MEACLVESVNNSLKLYMYRNATFLCERLFAESATENNLHLLATCYFRSNQAYRAYHLLKGSKSAQCRYLFALACYEMGSMAEAEAALLPPGEPTAEVPNGAAGYYMLGLICRLTDRRQAAVGHYTQALSLDPFFWSAYEDLCLLGVDEDTSSLFGELAVLRLQQQHQQLQWEAKTQYSAALGDNEGTSTHFSNVLRSSYPSNGSPKHSKIISSMPVGIQSIAVQNSVASAAGSPFFGTMSSFSTPSPQMPQVVPPTPVRNVLGAAGLAGGDMFPKANNPPVQPQRRKFLDEGKLRKVSGRLFAEPAPRRSLRLSGDATTTTTAAQVCSTSGSTAAAAAAAVGSNANIRVSTANTTSVRNSRKGLSGIIGTAEGSFDDGRRFGGCAAESTGSDDVASSSHSSLGDDEMQYTSRNSAVVSRSCKVADGAYEVLALFRILGEGYRHLSMYRSQEALQSFMKLPHHQFETNWVLCQVGRAYFEMVDYAEAERTFIWARRLSPYRLEGTDVYSTVLYHMKKDVELSYLAQEAVSMDRMSPQAWCVIGNCFSLQKDHETALKFFQRALQLDTHFTYAHTLCGHEYVAMEDFEEGLACYRNAIRMDARHYNAWYGLGTIYFRQEKYELAEYHFRRALQINGRSSVLHCYLGMALHALKKNEEALDLLGQAMSADPKNPLPKYQKANVLMSEERYEEALCVLEQLKEVAPRESSVYFLIGKLFKRLNQPERAMYHFCIALDLKPSTADVNLIKTAIEKLHVPDGLEEENL